MEEALVLARTASAVTILHRRDSFRASTALSSRVLTHPKITVVWNATVRRFEGQHERTEDQPDGVDVLRRVIATIRKRGGAEEEMEFDCRAAFVAIGHRPNTDLFAGQLEMEPSGYLVVANKSTATSTPGVFAAGDVADHVYRQAITSAGSGAMAALDAERWLSTHAPALEPTPPNPAKPGEIHDCSACVAAGYGWSPKKEKCGRFQNKQCSKAEL
eukprot:SAG31_NODE_4120_length_3564_cov_1.635498_2_plen_216_part_00